MAKNVSIWIDNEKFKEMAKTKATSNLNWAQILELGIFTLSKVDTKGNVNMGSGNWEKLFPKE